MNSESVRLAQAAHSLRTTTRFERLTLQGTSHQQTQKHPRMLNTPHLPDPIRIIILPNKLRQPTQDSYPSLGEIRISRFRWMTNEHLSITATTSEYSIRAIQIKSCHLATCKYILCIYIDHCHHISRICNEEMLLLLSIPAFLHRS